MVGTTSPAWRLVDAEVAAEFGDVSGGLDVVHRVLDASVRADHEGGPDDALYRTAVVLLLAVGAVRGEHRLVGVGDQREVQSVTVAEGGQLGGRVGGDADHLETGRLERGQRVA